MNESLDFSEYSELFKGEKFSTAGTNDFYPINRALIIGTCLTELIQLTMNNYASISSDFLLFLRGELPTPPRVLDDYDLQIIQIPLRLIIQDHDLMSLNYQQYKDWEHAFLIAKSRLKEYFYIYTKYLHSHQKTTFVLNYMSPCINTLGRLHKNGDLRNINFFIDELNKFLEELTLENSNCFLIDVDNLANMHGKRYFSEEFLGWYSHGGVGWPLVFDGLDGSRLEKTPHTCEHFEVGNTQMFIMSLLNEIRATWSTLKNHNSIKLIVVDLDDTLWRGVAGEMIKDDQLDSGMMNAVWGDIAEGWPLGIIEALQICKMRGLILGIISKNFEENINKIFPKIFGGKINLEDFSIRRINWLDKKKNMEDILSVVNILPENVLYIDDSPLERSLMSSYFPKMKVIGKYFQYTRHILISSHHTQVANINDEATARGESIKFRDTIKNLGDAESSSINQLIIDIKVHTIKTSSPDLIIKRLIELTQKTNQWKLNDIFVPDYSQVVNFLNLGGQIFCYEVTTNGLNFGVVGVVFYYNETVDQFVMSCRVAGLNLEAQFLNRLLTEIQLKKFYLNFIETEKNLPMKNWISKSCELENGKIIYS